MEREKYMVRGTGIKTKFEFVHERFGESASAQFRDRLLKTVQWPILVGGWYTFDQYAEVLSVMVEMFYGGNNAALREVGSHSAEKLLSTTYQAFRTIEDIAKLVERLPSLYQRFYNCGSMLIDFDPRQHSCKFRFTGAPVYLETDMEVAVGFTRRCWTFSGVDAAISGLSVGSTSASFDLRWFGSAARPSSHSAVKPAVAGTRE